MHLEDQIDELRSDIGDINDRLSIYDQLIKMLLVGHRVKLFQARDESHFCHQRVIGTVTGYDDFRNIFSDTEHGKLRSELWEVMEILDAS